MNANVSAQAQAYRFLLKTFHEDLLKNSEEVCYLSDLKIVCSDGTLNYSKLLLSICLPYLRFIEFLDCEIIWPEVSVKELSVILYLKLTSHDAEIDKGSEITNSATTGNRPPVEEFSILIDVKDYEQNSKANGSEDFVLNFIEEENSSFMTPERSPILDAKGHMCEECGLCYSSEEKLKKHVKWKHQTKSSDFECNVCQKKFQHNFLLQRHYVMHKEPSLKCGLCSKYFKHQSNLSAHMKATHKDNEGTKSSLICPTCGKVFKKKSNLTRHLIVHSSDKFNAFQCVLCDKTYNDQSSLERHLLSHHVGNTFKCPKCNKEFTRRDSFSRHDKKCKN